MFLLPEQLVQVCRNPFSEAAVVDKNERCAVRGDRFYQSREDQRPDAVGREVGKILSHARDLQIHFLFIAGVNDCDVARSQLPVPPFLPAEEPRNRLQRPLRCG